jgi:hypothetical protein
MVSIIETGGHIKPGSQAEAVIFNRVGETGMAAAAAVIHLAEEESAPILKRLRAANIPYELQAPYGALAVKALRKSAEERSSFGAAAKKMVTEFDLGSYDN